MNPYRGEKGEINDKSTGIASINTHVYDKNNTNVR